MWWQGQQQVGVCGVDKAQSGSRCKSICLFGDSRVAPSFVRYVCVFVVSGLSSVSPYEAIRLQVWTMGD